MLDAFLLVVFSTYSGFIGQFEQHLYLSPITLLSAMRDTFRSSASLSSLEIISLSTFSHGVMVVPGWEQGLLMP